jgi:hypothetical protein
MNSQYNLKKKDQNISYKKSHSLNKLLEYDRDRIVKRDIQKRKSLLDWKNLPRKLYTLLLDWRCKLNNFLHKKHRKCYLSSNFEDNFISKFDSAKHY